MLFILSFLIIFISELIFINSLTDNSDSLLQILGYLHLILFLSSFLFLTLLFRNRKKQTDFKLAFTLFGTLIICSIPTLAYLIPGIAYLLSENIVFQRIGWLLSGIMFFSFVIGIVYGRWNWKVHRIELEFPHLPADFHEIKLVQISDVHLGSFFNNHKKVKKAIDKINQLKPNYVFFTGDLVNNTAEEIHGWEDILKKIFADKGKFSILGNHDYGDYVKWETHDHKQKNLDKLIQLHKSIGFTPLLNESVELTQGFWLLGVENWGKAPFRQSGKLHDTLQDIPDNHFKLLLSHDPSHFDEEVVKTNIDLTLSGHTHGMQFGFERFGLKWSPVSWRYKKWAGLYKEGNQYLYVNRGFGYIGFPGRVGIYPEITEIILRKN